jgi:hypothetical protein
MEIADLIQVIILVVLAFTAGFALKAIYETRNIHKETLEWNKKSLTINILKELREIKFDETKQIFFEYTNYGTEIPLGEILKAIEKNPVIKTEIVAYLNHHSGIAIGINQGLYDDEIVNKSRKNSFLQVYTEFKNYIYYRREVSNENAWIDFEKLVIKWGK